MSPSRPLRSPFERTKPQEPDAPATRRGRPPRQKVGAGPLDVFEPATLSMAECLALLEHLGAPTTVALHDTYGKEGVNPVEIRKWLDRFNELQELEDHRGIPWAGYEAVKDSITRYVLWQERCLDIQANGGPRHPSMHTWDSTGATYRGGIGADAQEMVRSEILDDGSRKTFTVHLRRALLPDSANAAARMPWLGLKRAPTAADFAADTVAHDETAATLTCSICGHVVSYDKRRGKVAHRLALGRVARHLKEAKVEVSRHRALQARLFRQPG